MNLSAGCAALPVEVLQRAQREFMEFRGNDGKPRGLSVTEMGYRTADFYELLGKAEEQFRTLMSIPDTHEVHVSSVGRSWASPQLVHSNSAACNSSSMAGPPYSLRRYR